MESIMSGFTNRHAAPRSIRFSVFTLDGVDLRLTAKESGDGRLFADRPQLRQINACAGPAIHKEGATETCLPPQTHVARLTDLTSPVTLEGAEE
jgi:hypothetical protein